MNTVARLRRYLTALLHRRTVRREIDDELHFHLERCIAENLAAGMDAHEAARDARRRFGNLVNVREECQDVRGARWGESTVRDVVFALRQIRRSPGLSAVAILTLALGIGANTALFSVIRAVLLRPLPYAESDRIVQCWGTRPATGHLRARTSHLNFLDFRDQNTSFSHLAFYRSADFHFTGTDRPAETRVCLVSDQFFDVLRVPPLLGRTFVPGENVPGNAAVVVLGHGLWTRRFGGDTNIIGRTIGLEGREFLVCGVMPPAFTFPERTEMWAPYAPSPDPAAHKRSDHFHLVIGRLKAGRSLDEAQAEMSTLARRLEQTYPEANDGAGCLLIPLHRELVGDFQPALLLLLAAVGCVLLIACANVANLQFIRGLGRQKELSIRAAIGASRGRLVRQLLIESLVLALIGGVAGTAVAHVALEGILTLAPSDVPRLQESRLDATVLLGSLALAFFTGILSGTVPALAASRPDLMAPLKDGGLTSTDGARRWRFRHWLVVGETATTIVLLIAAGLLMQSFRRMTATPLGFRTDDLATLRVTLPWEKYHGAGRERRFFKELLGRVRSRAGAERTALVCALPIADRQTTVWFKEAGIAYEPGREPIAGFNYVTPSYLETLGIPLLRGRNLDDHDTDTTPRVLVIDETLASRHFRGVDPIGRRVLIEGQGDEPFTIVGMAGPVMQRGVLRGPAPQLYMHYQQINECSMWVVTRGASRMPTYEALVAGEVRAMDTDQSTGPFKTMEQHLEAYSTLARFRTRLTQGLATLALGLAVVGIYSVIAFTAHQRTREFGVRLALGATPTDILRLILGSGGRLALLGIGLGTALALALTHLLKDMLYGVSPHDITSFGIVIGGMLATALLTSYLPARRAARIDPIVALRAE